MKYDEQDAYTWFQNAIVASGGTAPIGRNGRAQIWDERRGWHDDPETRVLNGGYGGELAGDGWQVLSSPFFPHADLENLARSIYPLVCPWSRWPAGWSVRFAELSGRHGDLAALTLFAPRLILISEARLLEREDLEVDLRESILHEFAHVNWGQERDHDPHFYQTLAEMRARCP